MIKLPTADSLSSLASALRRAQLPAQPAPSQAARAPELAQTLAADSFDAGVQNLLAGFDPAASPDAFGEALFAPITDLESPAPAAPFEPLAADTFGGTSDADLARSLLQQAEDIDSLGDALGLPDWASAGSGGGSKNLVIPPGAYDDFDW